MGLREFAHLLLSHLRSLYRQGGGGITLSAMFIPFLLSPPLLSSLVWIEIGERQRENEGRGHGKRSDRSATGADSGASSQIIYRLAPPGHVTQPQVNKQSLLCLSVSLSASKCPGVCQPMLSFVPCHLSCFRRGRSPARHIPSIYACMCACFFFFFFFLCGLCEHLNYGHKL